MEAERGETGPVWVSVALRVLGAALGGPRAPRTSWFKESSQKNLRSRDFLVPRGALKKSFPDGEVPEEFIQKLTFLNIPGVPPIKRCLQSEAGLVVQLDRPAVFHRVLKDFTPYLKPVPSVSDNGQNVVILNCAPLHSCQSLDAFKLGHLRAVLIADHLAEVLRLRGAQVHLVPAVHSKEVEEFLHHLGISWPCDVKKPSLEETISSYKDHLKDYTSTNNASVNSQQPVEESSQHIVFSVQLKSYAEKQNLCLQGYDPNLDFFLGVGGGLNTCKRLVVASMVGVCGCAVRMPMPHMEYIAVRRIGVPPVNEEDLAHVARLQRSVREILKEETPCTVLHVVSCEEEFHQQKLNLLWTLLDPGATTITQKHLICGPVKVLYSPSPASCSQYFHVRKSQMREASVMKYGERVQGDSWDEIINSLTSAAIKFELMATPHRTQVTLNMEDTNITTKGTRSGAFVMYNCARLATMFDSYNCAVRQGLYPEFPQAEDLNYSSLSEEGEWLLLFNYIMMLPEVLSQAAQISLTSPGIRVTANTEAVCKFLVSLSMDFSCYYNRVHILGEPLPHLFSRMFARLQLMKAVRSVLHSALDTLHIHPLTQI